MPFVQKVKVRPPWSLCDRYLALVQSQTRDQRTETSEEPVESSISCRKIAISNLTCSIYSHKNLKSFEWNGFISPNKDIFEFALHSLKKSDRWIGCIDLSCTESWYLIKAWELNDEHVTDFSDGKWKYRIRPRFSLLVGLLGPAIEALKWTRDRSKSFKSVKGQLSTDYIG